MYALKWFWIWVQYSYFALLGAGIGAGLVAFFVYIVNVVVGSILIEPRTVFFFWWGTKFFCHSTRF